jgi:hypothetical protein
LRVFDAKFAEHWKAFCAERRAERGGRDGGMDEWREGGRISVKNIVLNAFQTVTKSDLRISIGFWSRGERAQKGEERRWSLSVAEIELGGGYMKDLRCDS